MPSPIVFPSSPPPPPYQPTSDASSSTSLTTQSLPFPSPPAMGSTVDAPASLARGSDIASSPLTPSGHWRPTERVPTDMARRHRAHNGDNKWLSEDEGSRGIAAAIGRRRRSSNEHRRNGDGAGGPGSGPGPRPGPGPSTVQRKLELETKDMSHSSSTRSRRRAQSFSAEDQIVPKNATGSQKPSDQVGCNPPSIHDITSDARSPVQMLGMPPPTTKPVDSMPDPIVHPPDPTKDGDVSRVVQQPRGQFQDVDDFNRVRREQDELLGKLYRILAW